MPHPPETGGGYRPPPCQLTTRPLLSAACVLAIGGVFAEGGTGLLLPGTKLDMLGEAYA